MIISLNLDFHRFVAYSYDIYTCAQSADCGISSAIGQTPHRAVDLDSRIRINAVNHNHSIPHRNRCFRICHRIHATKVFLNNRSKFIPWIFFLI